jgi:hypothetical protein
VTTWASVIDRTMAASLQVLVSIGLPVLTVPPRRSRATSPSRVAVVVDGLASRRFIGVQLATGSHADLLGVSVGVVERRVCGTPEPGNIDGAQALTVG